MKRFTQQITLKEMETEMKREIAVRRRVYPNWIQSGKLNEQTADFRILVLEANLVLIQDQIKKHAPQGDLFQ